MAADERSSRGLTPFGPDQGEIETPGSLPGGWSERSEAARHDRRGRRLLVVRSGTRERHEPLTLLENAIEVE